ncbi:hypothetical protein BC826DRAFT_95566 [Russula brevipes]|nr:hypothetical protein BC826DRAFT_95566 [Russula brevipes]
MFISTFLTFFRYQTGPRRRSPPPSPLQPRGVQQRPAAWPPGHTPHPSRSTGPGVVAHPHSPTTARRAITPARPATPHTLSQATTPFPTPEPLQLRGGGLSGPPFCKSSGPCKGCRAPPKPRCCHSISVSLMRYFLAHCNSV